LLKAVFDRQVQRWPEEVFDLSIQVLSQMHEHQNGLCHWYGVPFTYETKSGPTLISVDRLDNSRGYTKDNVVLACDAANRGRKDYSPEQFSHFVAQLRASMRG
jgi:hypothetical protein